MNLVYGITVSTEEYEIKRLVTFLKKNTDKKIVVQCDTTKISKDLFEDLNQFDISVHGTIFQNDFSLFKNELNDVCQKMGADYIFQLDADEMISEFLVKNIDEIVNVNSQVELFYFPRINTVEGITLEHVKKWNWNLDSSNRINFPDFQGRLYRSNLRWSNKVHEKITGVRHYSLMPLEEKYCIIHEKTIQKQESQNTLYSSI